MNEKLSRRYIRLKGRVDIEKFRLDVQSGNFAHEQIENIYCITGRQVYYLMKKYEVENHLIHDRSYRQTPEYRASISRANKGKKRTELHKENYRRGISKRRFRNNREIGSWSPSEQTRRKMKETNIKTWETLPAKWIKACLQNEQWYENLRNAERPAISQEHIRKVIETKVGMPFDVWEIVRGEVACYRAKVRTITELQDLSKLEHIEKRGTTHHLDHMFSISSGFYEQISPEIVGNIVNLVVIPSFENLSKNKKNSIALEELVERYNGRTR